MKDHPSRCVRKNFDKDGGVICRECFQRDLTIDNLREKLKEANAKIARLEKVKKPKITWKNIADEPHVPSSRRIFKKNSSLENQAKKGGAKTGHKGAGRRPAATENILECITAPQSCPCCKVALVSKDLVRRTFVDVKPVQAVRRIITLKRGQCPKCRKTFKGPLPALPKALYGNQLLSQALIMHYVHGIAIGRVLEIFGPEVSKGGLINSFHCIGKLCEPARDELIKFLRSEDVRNADETGWRTDGQSGYAWIFRTQNTTIFEHCDSRGSKIPRAILGNENLEGYLVVDRYNAYNKVPVKIQYCYAHLLREVAKLEREFSDNVEINRFKNRMCSLLSEAMRLQKMGMTPELYLVAAQGVRQAIIKEINYPYEHLAIKRIQQIFSKHKKRMYHWADNPNVPADNNRAEREIRSTVIARKTSFGSQSKRGAKTRSNVMSVLFTVKKRLKNISLEEWLFQTLNSLAQNSELKIIDMLPR